MSISETILTIKNIVSIVVKVVTFCEKLVDFLLANTKGV